MYKKFHRLIGKLFLSGASFFWVSCDSSSSAEEPGPFIDIEKELAKLQPDTTRGQCISAYSYCNEIDYNASDNGFNMAVDIVSKKKDSLFSTKQGAAFSYAKRKCYEKLIGNYYAPEYGVSYCSDFYDTEYNPKSFFSANEKSPSAESALKEYQHFVKENNLTECEPVTEGVRIDDQYIKIVTENYEHFSKIVREKLEEINENATECEAME